jgi:hypothetical protein
MQEDHKMADTADVLVEGSKGDPRARRSAAREPIQQFDALELPMVDHR